MFSPISTENCNYRGEGNDGLVVNLLKEEKVLKLKKQSRDFRVLQNADAVFKELENQIKVINSVFKTIMGSPFIISPGIMFLRNEEMKLLNEITQNLRPVHRKHKVLVEEDTYALVMQDLCCLPQSLKHIPTCGSVLSIEIKPKQGFVKEEYLSNGMSSLSLPICRCCMMKQYKLKNQVLLSKCKYCPTDLFSGCHTRMLHALRMLLETPQNNLRIFKNKKLAYSEEKKGNLDEILADFLGYSEEFRCEDIFCDIILQSLLRPFPHETKFGNPIFLSKAFSQNCINAHNICTETDKNHTLPHCSILERLLNVQLLDNMPMIDLYKLYLKLDNKDDSYSIGCYSQYEIPPHLNLLERAPEESEYQYASRKIWEFLLSLTAKDCSVMLVLQQIVKNSIIEDTQNVIGDMLGNKYVFSISLMDMGIKALSKVEKVYKDTESILKSILNK